MYRILIAMTEIEAFNAFKNNVEWQSISFREPMYAQTADEAINLMETRRVDCIAYVLNAQEARKLNKYLSTVRPSLPVFQIKRDREAQMFVMRDMLRYLDRLHSDMSDDIYDENVVMEMLRDELSHNLLAGEILNGSMLRARLQMLRSSVDPDKKCVLYDFDMPQGEVYLMNQWHYGSERLANALRNNFFGRYYDDIFYSVAVLTPRHIRVLACQRVDGKEESEESLLDRTDAHIGESLENIKEYLGLDLILTQTHILDNLNLLTQETV